MTEGAPPFVIVAGVSASSSAEQVVDSAAALARRIPGSALHLVHALDLASPGLGLRGETAFAVAARRRAWLDRLGERATSEGAPHVSTHLAQGVAASTLVRRAGDLDADVLLVAPSRRTKRGDAASTADEVARAAGCPVVLVRAKGWKADA